MCCPKKLKVNRYDHLYHTVCVFPTAGKPEFCPSLLLARAVVVHLSTTPVVRVYPTAVSRQIIVMLARQVHACVAVLLSQLASQRSSISPPARSGDTIVERGFQRLKHMNALKACTTVTQHRCISISAASHAASHPAALAAQCMSVTGRRVTRRQAFDILNLPHRTTSNARGSCSSAKTSWNSRCSCGVSCSCCSSDAHAATAEWGAVIQPRPHMTHHASFACHAWFLPLVVQVRVAAADTAYDAQATETCFGSRR